MPEDVDGVVAVVRLGPAGRKPGSLRNVLFERVGSPARFVVEAQPLPERGQLPGFGVVRKYAGMNDRVVRAGEHVVRPFAPARRLVSHPRGRSFGIAGRDARLLAHMAVLAGRALPGRRRVLELAEGFLQPETVREVDVVTGAAEPGARQLEERAGFGVHGASRALGVRLEVQIAAADGLGEPVIPAGTEHRLLEASLDEGQPAADLSVRLVLPVTDDAGDSFLGRRMPVEVRLEGGFAQVHPDRGVAADAEVAVRAVRQLSDLRLHRVEDRAELGVGVGRDRPLAIDVPVARGAGGSRRKPFFGEERGVPVLDLVRLRDRRRRSSHQHRDCPQEANSTPNKGPVPVAAPVPAIELTAQRNAWHRGGRFFEPSPAGRRGTTGSMRSTLRSELDYGDVCRSMGHLSGDP